MKKLFILFIFVSVCKAGFSQEQETIATFKITEASINGVDKTDYFYSRQQYIVFYKTTLGKLAMSNISDIANQQSYGNLFIEKRVETIPQSYKSWQVHVFTYRWNYSNSYDSNTGWANVTFYKIYKPQGVVFLIKIVLTNLDIIEYSGYMEGTVDF